MIVGTTPIVSIVCKKAVCKEKWHHFKTFLHITLWSGQKDKWEAFKGKKSWYRFYTCISGICGTPNNEETNFNNTEAIISVGVFLIQTTMRPNCQRWKEHLLKCSTSEQFQGTCGLLEYFLLLLLHVVVFDKFTKYNTVRD